MSLSARSSVSCTVGEETQQQSCGHRGVTSEDGLSTQPQVIDGSNNSSSSTDPTPPVTAVTTEKTSIPHMTQSFYMLLLVGVNEANIGIIIPSLRVHYNLSQVVVSVIFLCVTFGNVSGM